jgi:(p)ppGpp synthase/HD superfamily hydrolase
VRHTEGIAMSLDAADRSRLLRAHALALEWHAGQTRKGNDIPYVSHLVQVSGGVLEFGGDVDQAIAGLLHDALEDAPSADERRRRERAIAAEFGRDVLSIVLDCTDTASEDSLEDKSPWTERKRRYIAQLEQADARSLLVAGCDKRHNLHALLRDLRQHGPDTLERFSAGADDQLWYFEGVLDALRGGVPEPLQTELEALVGELRARIG